MRAAAPLSILLFASNALAQTAPAGEPPIEPRSPKTEASAEPSPLPDDPMLDAPAPPKRLLQNWEQARQILRARSTDLRIAIAEVMRAEAQSRTALAAALPSVNLNVNAQHNLLTNEAAQIAGVNPDNTPRFTPISVPVPNILNGNITAAIPLVNVRTWYAVGTAKRSAEASRLRTEDIKRTLVTALASAVVNVYTAERVAEINRINLQNALERLALTERRQVLGAVGGLDVVRAQQDAEATRGTLIAGDESLRQSREALGLALGYAEPVGVPQNLKLDELARAALGSCKKTDGVDTRADVAALKKNAEVGARQINEARQAFLPTVTLQSTLSSTSQDTGALPRTLWNVQALIAVPIWDGGARYGAMRDANARYEQALQNLEAQRRSATIEASRALRQVTVAETNLRISTQTRDLSLENDRLTRAAYAEGRGTSLELTASANALRQAEVNLVVREFELVQARIGAALVLATCEV